MKSRVDAALLAEDGKTPRGKMLWTCASLFCGAGGLDMGFSRAGFRTVWANDSDPDACDTFRKWCRATVVCGDVSKVDFGEVPATDVILGGFPCQGFSLSGPRKMDDSRNTLYRHYVRMVSLKQPKAFVGENVKGLLTMGGGKIFEAIVADFERCGYRVFHQLVNAKDYGVPQDRERVIIAGFRNDLGVEAFEIPKPGTPPVTLLDAIGNTPDAHETEICSAPYSPRYISRNRRRDWGQVSFTIPAMAKQVPLHPSSPEMEKVGKDVWRFGEGTTRRLSYREAAAIQTFPHGMEFCGDLTSKYRQVGNAVPVKLAEAVARAVSVCLPQDAEGEILWK